MKEEIFIEKLQKRRKTNGKKWSKQEAQSLIKHAKSEELWSNIEKNKNNDVTLLFMMESEYNEYKEQIKMYDQQMEDHIHHYKYINIM